MRCIPPIETQSQNKDGITYTHPAYGVITMSRVQGNPGSLFGSDINHSGYIHIEVQRAELDRHLNCDWVHAKEMVLEFDMSFSQFAKFITSSNDGSGTPVTLRVMNCGEPVEIPGIEKIESKRDLHRREIKESAEKEIKAISEMVAQLGRMLDEGKGKKDLRELHHSLKCAVGNLPSNMVHTVESAEKALEHATTAAKIDVEAYVDMMHRRHGADELFHLANERWVSGEAGGHLESIEQGN